MLQTVRITSKRQITIPVLIFRKLMLETGQNLVVERDHQSIVLTPAEKIVERLSGSIKLPSEHKGENLGKIIVNAKKEHFRNKRG